MRIPKGGESIDQRQSKAQAKFAIEPWLDGMVRYDTVQNRKTRTSTVDYSTIEDRTRVARTCTGFYGVFFAFTAPNVLISVISVEKKAAEKVTKKEEILLSSMPSSPAS